MNAPSAIIDVWERFSAFPTETLTKAWWYQECQGSPRQRPVEVMKEHRAVHGTTGNCFDVALWLREEFTSAGIETQIIGRGLCTPSAHIAVIAFDERGYGFFCDLGDQWLQPILVHNGAPGFSPGFHSGFAPGMRVRVQVTADALFFTYLRASGKESIEQFPLAPVSEDTLNKACDHSQALLRRPFVEIRAAYGRANTRQLWEYDRRQCRWYLDTGMIKEEDCDHRDCWTERIHQMAGISLSVIATAFDVYARYGIEM